MVLCKTCKTSGFTLPELIIVLAILAIVAALLLPNLNIFQRQSALDAAANEILATLRLAQNKTLASEGASSWGVNFTDNQFIFFKGASFVPGSSDNEIHSLPSNVVLSEVNLGGLSAVVFSRLTGAANISGSIKISLDGDASQSREIFIDESGTLGLGDISGSDQERLQDSRHIHINYAQNTKNAATLSLVFPLDGVTQNISYQGYLDGAKTEFSWEGEISVAGSPQQLKIHSHALTDSETLFCVHRDRRYNDRALNINLDGQNLINYAADGTTTPGTSLWADPPQEQ